MTRRISIFGSTGSVGKSTIKVLQAQDETYDVQVITAHQNVELLAAQAKTLNAKYAVIADETRYQELKEVLAGTNIKAMAGEAALIEAAAIPADWIMAAIVGMAGLRPLMTAIEQGQGTIVAIANKEPLVAAGPIVMDWARQNGTTILPIDSEHNAVFQVFEPDNKTSIERIVLTASGGPFREMPAQEMKNVTVAQALAHPNWCMGDKISIDSATMMNKALEVIEAQRLFDMPADKIEVLVHPQSVVHSMIEYSDGSFLAQMGAADMCTPITNALGWPKRLKTPGEKLDLAQLKQLDFLPVDVEHFPFVQMAYDCLESGLPHCVAMNAANEMAVQAFLSHKIDFLDIYRVTHAIVQKQESSAFGSLDDLDNIIQYDQDVRAQTESYMMDKNLNSKVAI